MVTQAQLLRLVFEAVKTINNSGTKNLKVNTETLSNSIYPLRRTLFVITKQSTQEGKQDKNYIAGKAYADWLLSPEGQNLIAEAGFGPIQ